jgi:hypothetical protein
MLLKDSENNWMQVLYKDALDNQTYSHTNSAVITSGEVGNWIHFVITIDVSSQTFVFYKDGSVVASTTPGTDASSIADTNASLYIGSCFDGGLMDFMNGAMDEIAIYSKILSSTEVTQLYNGGAGLQYPFTAGPSNLKTYNTNAKSNCKNINTNLIANCKSLDTNV